MKDRQKFSVLLPFAAALLWIGQMYSSEVMTSNACYPHEKPLTVPLWSGLPQMLTMINILCLACGFLFCILAWKAWQKARSATHLDTQLVAPHEGRRKFIATVGMLSNLLFTLAIMFTSCATLLVSPCADWK